MQWKVGRNENGLNILSFLKNKLPSRYSARQLKRILEAGACELNGKIERFGSKHLAEGDLIQFSDLQVESSTPFIMDPNAILYEDEDLLAYDKPAHLVSDSKETLKAFKHYHSRLELVHRLDKDTTGVLLFSKNDHAKEFLLKLFRDRKIKKTYHALVDNNCKEPEGFVENYLGTVGQFQGQTLYGKVDKSKGLLAITHWYCERQLHKAALVRCLPLTGRTHQIRVHMRDLGHPILGDYQYCKKFNSSYKPERFLLHASSIEFTHPTTRRNIRIESSFPEDFKKILIQKL